VLCPPSISTKSTGEAILFAACLGYKDSGGPLGWEPAQATAGATAAAEVTVAGADSSHHLRDRSDVGAAANTVAGASGGSRIFEQGASAEVMRHHRLRGYGEGEGLCPYPEFSSSNSWSLK